MKQAFPGDRLQIKAEDWNRVRQISNTGRTGVTENRKRVYSEIAIAYTDAPGIAARSGTTLGSGTVTFYGVTDGGVLTATTETATAYNITQSAVVGNTYVVVGREFRTNKWIVIVEDCGAGGS
jgi:phosphoribulokinase